MRSFDLRPQIERLTASGIGRIQRIQDDVYRKLWPETVEMPERHEGRFDRALIVDVFPLYPMHTAVDHGGRRVTLPVRLLPLPGTDKPTAVAFNRDAEHALLPLLHPRHGDLLRYVIFWQAGERYKGKSPNVMHSRFEDDERGLGLNEALQLALQEEDLVRKRRLPFPLTDHLYDRGEIYGMDWPETAATPFFSFSFGMYTDPEGVPSRAMDVIPVSTEVQDLFLKE